MKQAVTVVPHNIEIRDAKRIAPGPDQIQVRVECVGICGSDLHIFSGHHPRATFPRVQGHEVSAQVERLGPGYDGKLQIGDRVAIDPLITCGECYACSIGRSNCCPNLQVIGAHVDGFLQEFATVPSINVYRASDLTADETALCEPVSVGLQAIVRGDVQPGEQVLIIGAGPIGACTAVAAIDRGARVMIVDPIPSRLELAQRLGAEQIVQAGMDDLPRAVADWTGGRGAQVTIDAVGSPAVIRQCCELVSPAGRVVIVGLSDREVSLPIVDFTYKEMTILGSRASARLFNDAIALVDRHRHRLAELITHRYALADAQRAIELAMGNPEETSKVLIEVWSPGD